MSQAALSRLRQAKAFLLDMDGTLYVDEKALPGARELVALLRDRGLPHLFLTNNSSRTGEHYRARLDKLGIPARRDEVFTSGDATIEFLLRETPHRSCYLVGTPDLEAEFCKAGLDLDADDPDCVVAAFDTTLTYEKLRRACALLFAGKPYYATHPDRTCITKDGLIPDAAAVIGACEAVTGRRPRIVGKPDATIVRMGLARLGAAAADTVIVGDQLDTDLTMARRSGLLGVLVLSGETSPARAAAVSDGERPDLVVENVSELVRHLRSAP